MVSADSLRCCQQYGYRLGLLLDQFHNERSSRQGWGHAGVYWYSRICQALEVDAGPTFRKCIQALTPDVLKGPFNHTGRAAAGLPQSW